MSTATESAIEKRVNSHARTRGWLTFKFVSVSQRGVPDRIYMKSGEVFFIEFKSPGKKVTALQQHIHEQIRGAGIRVYVIDNIDDGKAVFND